MLGKIKKSVAVVGVTLLATIGLLGGGASTASASLSECKPGWSCSYEYFNNYGRTVKFQNYVPDYGKYTGMNNNTSSIYNNGTKCDVMHYQLKYGRGHKFHLKQGTYTSNLSWFRMTSDKTWNNRISSGYFCH